MKLGLNNISNIKAGATKAIIKVMGGNKLIWQAVQDSLWNLQDYVSRVENDYGQVEDSVTLDAEIKQEEYNEAIAIYNPNGGYRREKIYNVRNLDGVEPTYDLEVTGGGGTRINAQGEVTNENLYLYNQLFNSHLSSGYEKVGSTLVNEPGHLLLTPDSSDGNHLAYWKLPVSGDNNPNIRSSYQVELKKTNTRYVIVGSRIDSFTSTATIDLDTKTIVRDNIASAGATDTTLEILDDGWVRVSWHVYYSAVERKSLVVGLSTGESSGDISFSGNNNSVMFRRAQSVSSNYRVVKPYQIRLGEYEVPAFTKIDYSTGQQAFLIEPQRTNYLLNSTALATQDVLVTVEPYTLSFLGTGIITLSGAYSGSLQGTGANDKVELTFTPTSGTLTVTVSGTCSYAQLEKGSNSTTSIITKGSAVTRTESIVSVSVPIGVTEIEEVVDGTINIITNIPAIYQMPQGRVESVIFR